MATEDDIEQGTTHGADVSGEEIDGDYQNENAQGEFNNPYFVAADRWDKWQVPQEVRDEWDSKDPEDFPDHWLEHASNNGFYPGYLPKLDPAVKSGWLTDLRSGTFIQCKSDLKKRDDDGVLTHCCLGVLYERFDGATQEPKPSGQFIFKEPAATNGGFTHHESMPGAKVRDWAQLPYSIASVLAEANDSGHVTFAEIADFVEKEL